MSKVVFAALTVAMFLGQAPAALAQTGNSDGEQTSRTNKSAFEAKRNAANAGTVGIITGPQTGTYIRIGADLANVLNGVDGLRVIPMMGVGSRQNIDDILYLRGVDIGIVQADVLDFIIENNQASADIKNRIAYIAKLYNEEAHILVKGDINSVKDLEGKKVNFDKVGSGTSITATAVFKKLGISVEQTNFDGKEALEKLKAGEISAMFAVAGKPSELVLGIKAEDNIKLLPIPFEDALQDVYLPSKFTSQDYPLLVKDQAIPTVATSAVMAIYNWPENSERHKKVTKFIKAFFENFDKFLDPARHKKWKEVSLAAKMPGWTRYPVAEQLLGSVKSGEASSEGSGGGDVQKKFNKFVENLDNNGKSLTPQQRQDLFNQFVKWSKNNQQ